MLLPNEYEVHEGHRLGWQGPTSRPVLEFANYLTGVLPATPPSADNMSEVTNWNGATNKRYGTCGPCSYANLIIMAYKYLAGIDVTVTDDAIFAFYRESGNPDFSPQTDTGDNGVDNSVMMAAAQRVGLEVTFPDGHTEFIKPVAYGRISGDLVDNIRAATALFGGVIIGVQLDTAQQAQTRATPAIWDYVASGPWGGHDIFGGSYSGSSASGQPDEFVISWQKKVGMTDAFEEGQIQEVFVVVIPVMLEHHPILAGVDWTALAADYEDLTGRPFPVPVPAPQPPAPGPTPEPGDPDPHDEKLKLAFDTWLEQKHL